MSTIKIQIIQKKEQFIQLIAGVFLL